MLGGWGLHRIGAHIDDDSAFLHHVSSNEFGLGNSRNDDISSSCDLFEVLCVGVAHGHGRVSVHQQHGHGEADDVTRE